MTETAVAGPGHNLPPDPIEALRETLSKDNEDLTTRRDELLAACERMPERVDDEETAGKFTDQIKLLKACAKTADKRRVDAKEPHLVAGRAVDAFFKKDIVDPVNAAAAKANKPLTDYERRKAQAEQQRRRDEERRAREAAERAAAEARTDEDLSEAVEAEQQARDASKAAQATAADLSRTRGDLGAVSSLRTTWKGEITDARDLDLEVLRPHISLDALQKAVNAYVRAGGRTLRGARIFEQHDTVVR